jgi:hypothetical protein
MSSTTLSDSRDGWTTPNSSEYPHDKYTMVEFDGEDDTWDPKNFSNLKKWMILLVVTHGAVIVTCASSIYVLISLLLTRLTCFRRRVTDNSKSNLKFLKRLQFLDYRLLSWDLPLDHVLSSQ